MAKRFINPVDIEVHRPDEPIIASTDSRSANLTPSATLRTAPLIRIGDKDDALIINAPNLDPALAADGGSVDLANPAPLPTDNLAIGGGGVGGLDVDDGSGQWTVDTSEVPLANISTGSNNTVVGFRSGSKITSGVNNTILGASSGNSMAEGESNVVIGVYVASSLDRGSEGNIIIGNDTAPKLTEGKNNVIIGREALNDRNGSGPANIGNDIIVIGSTGGDLSANGNASIYIGKGAKPGFSVINGLWNAIAIGQNAAVNADGAVSIGGNAQSFDVAIGQGTNAGAVGAVAIGTTAGASADHAVAIGGGDDPNGAVTAGGATTASSFSVAIGTASSIAGSSVGGIAIGANASVDVQGGLGTDSIAIGRNATAKGEKTVAIGSGANADGLGVGNNIAIGTDSASDYANVALGPGATAKGNVLTVADHRSNANVVIGSDAGADGGTAGNASMIGNVVLGSNAKAGKFGAAPATAGISGGIAIGNGARVGATSAIAIGRFASNNTEYSVQLGGFDDKMYTLGRPYKLAVGNSGYGTAGQVLTVNAAGTGVEWAAAGGGAATTPNVTVNNTAGQTPTTNPPAGTPHEGDVFINVPDGRTWIYDGAAWVQLPAPSCKFAADVPLTDSVPQNVVHNLNTEDVHLTALLNKHNVQLDWTVVDANTVSVTSTVTGTHRIVVGC